MQLSTGWLLSGQLTAMDYVLSVVALLAGLGAFLFGFKVLSDNIEKLATNRLRGWFDKVGKSRLAGVGIGTAVTAIIQSSSATTVMVVGFVNAGIMSLFQATAVIMGANIGTTITAYIASMANIPFVQFITLSACVGMFINMIAKSDRVKTAGLLLVGLGLVFIGLESMSAAMSQYGQSAQLQTVLASVSNPFLLLLVGIVLTAIVQSSSVVTSLVIITVSQGLAIGGGGNDVLFLILGSNIGTCVTALLSSVGANTNAKRASFIHLMFNVFGTVLFTVFLLCWPAFMESTLLRWFPDAPGLQIALFHTFFNVVCTCLFLPATNVFVRIATKLIGEKKRNKPETESDVAVLDERFISAPSVAVYQIKRAAAGMARSAMQSLRTAFGSLIDRNEAVREEVLQRNEQIAESEKRLVSYLVKLSATGLSLSDEQFVTAVHTAAGDIIRISELAENITKYTANIQKNGIEFSEGVEQSLREMYAKIDRLAACTAQAFEQRDAAALAEADALEDSIDAARREMVQGHIQRLNEGQCQPSSSGVFINLVGNLERAADHLTYIAHAFDELA